MPSEMKPKRGTIAIIALAIILFSVSIGVPSFLKHRRLAALKARKNMNGLVAWWPADGDATDVISGVTDIMENDAGFGPGVYGQAFDFRPGVNQTGLARRIKVAEDWIIRFFKGPRVLSPFPRYKHLHVTNRPNLQVTNAMTFEAWINPVNLGMYQDVIGKWSTIYPDLHPENSYTFVLYPDGRLSIGVSPTPNEIGSATISSKAILPRQTWTHVATTYDGNSLNLYVNGQLEASRPYDKGVYPGKIDMGIGCVVGHGAPGQCYSPFFGRICDVSIYNRALTTAEIQAEYEAGKTAAANTK